MNPETIKRLGSFSLALLLAFQAVPLLAEGEREADSELKPIDQLREDFRRTEKTLVAENSAEAPDLTAARFNWRETPDLQDTAADTPDAPKKKSWIKRRWWVPVVAAVVLGVALSDDDDNADSDSL